MFSRDITKHTTATMKTTQGVALRGGIADPVAAPAVEVFRDIANGTRAPNGDLSSRLNQEFDQTQP